MNHPPADDALAPDAGDRPLPASRLPAGVRSRFVDNHNGLRMHVLEAGADDGSCPCVLLLHGFPELAYSWRRILVPLAEAGFHVVAPDQRGYGRTTGWSADYDADLAPFRMTNLARDALGLLAALGHRTAAAVVGHDFGAPVAAWCALLRPDVFRRLALMSSPFAGPPAIPFDTARHPAAPPGPDIHAELARLDPPRKHYQAYYGTRAANADMWHCPQGVHDFLRAYYHHKSADWPGNRPHPLQAWRAEELARMPTYYIMHLHRTMAETVAEHMPDAAQVAAHRWLPDDELRLYSQEYGRTGFQGGLQWYRCHTGSRFTAELQTWSGRTIDVPAAFISGAQDWGNHQVPGALQAMRTRACTRMGEPELIEGAGHWVQQEQPQAVLEALLRLLRR